LPRASDTPFLMTRRLIPVDDETYFHRVAKSVLEWNMCASHYNTGGKLCIDGRRPRACILPAPQRLCRLAMFRLVATSGTDH
jgi:hypothetical protein